ncbi:MAG TPA: amidohydrolase family protein [Gemmatimonadaceae bacterium]
MRRTPLHRLVLPVAALALTQTAVGAQSNSRDNLTGVWALTNARIETVTKGTIERGTVVIRDGVIEAVGASVTPPADARVVDLSGKTLVPAFIDLTSSLGLPQPTAGRGGGGRGGVPAVPAVFGQPPETTTEERIVGLEPDRVIAEELNLSATDARTSRDQGIGAVLVAPARGLFRGLSALVPMRDDTASRWIVKTPVALHVGYQTVPGQYPGNLLGVIAYQRQAFYDAQRHAMVMDRYKANPRGVPRTAHNAELEALVPVVKGEMPAFIAANAENEILRALALAKEFNIKVTVVGAVEGFRAINALKSARPPVVTVDFPTPAQTTGWQYQFATRRDPADSAARTAAATRTIEGNAAALNNAGIKFALASGGLAAGTFMENVRKAIAAGLPRQVALEALTIRAAEAAGVDAQLGSIEAGKIANLLVVLGEPLAATARLESVYVDGLQYDVVPPAAGRGRGGRANNPPQMREE